MNKTEFFEKPEYVVREGNVIRINFDVEQQSTDIAQDATGSDGTAAETEPSDVYLASVVRVENPFTPDRIHDAVVAEGFSSDKADEVSARALLYLVHNGERCGDAIELAKKQMLALIAQYDKSDAVNAFTLKGSQVWLDKATRNALTVRLNAEKAAGKETSTLWFGSESVSVTPDEGLQMLSSLEVYAAECFDTTSRHEAAVSALDNEKDILAYAYKTGYPEQLSFD